MNLYNKIYKAINEGIQKALLIDPEQNDVSVNYSYHKIDNNTNLLPYYVDNLLNGDNNAYYDIIKYHNKNNHIYTPKNFNELYNIFDKISSIPDIPDGINWTWINMSDTLTFITNNNELTLNEIDNTDDIEFIKFDNIENFDHPIIIHKKLYNSDLQWRAEEITVPNCNNKMDGYKNTYNDYIQDKNNIEKYPAFKYCTELKLNGYDGYLPAINELNFLSNNEKIINFILQHINKKILNIDSGYWWSSTQFSSSYPWILDYGVPNYYFFTKCYSKTVLPFFRKNNYNYE